MGDANLKLMTGMTKLIDQYWCLPSFVWEAANLPCNATRYDCVGCSKLLNKSTGKCCLAQRNDTLLWSYYVLRLSPTRCCRKSAEIVVERLRTMVLFWGGVCERCHGPWTRSVFSCGLVASSWPWKCCVVGDQPCCLDISFFCGWAGGEWQRTGRVDEC